MTIQNLNTKIQNCVDIWNSLDFTKLSSITEKANIVIFYILTYDKKSYILLDKLNKLVKTKHPYGELIFYGYSNVNSEDEVSSTVLKKYKMVVSTEKDQDEEEYLQRTEIFYDELQKILEESK